MPTPARIVIILLPGTLSPITLPPNFNPGNSLFECYGAGANGNGLGGGGGDYAASTNIGAPNGVCHFCVGTPSPYNGGYGGITWINTTGANGKPTSNSQGALAWGGGPASGYVAGVSPSSYATSIGTTVHHGGAGSAGGGGCAGPSGNGGSGGSGGGGGGANGGGNGSTSGGSGPSGGGGANGGFPAPFGGGGGGGAGLIGSNVPGTQGGAPASQSLYGPGLGPSGGAGALGYLNSSTSGPANEADGISPICGTGGGGGGNLLQYNSAFGPFEIPSDGGSGGGFGLIIISFVPIITPFTSIGGSV